MKTANEKANKIRVRKKTNQTVKAQTGLGHIRVLENRGPGNPISPRFGMVKYKVARCHHPLVSDKTHLDNAS
jgi:hypothetical protein